MTVFAFSWLGYLGLGMVLLAVVVLLVSTFHPEGRRRPGGYLDGRAPDADDGEPPPGG